VEPGGRVRVDGCAVRAGCHLHHARARSSAVFVRAARTPDRPRGAGVAACAMWSPGSIMWRTNV
jgi:hypothetical protein